ncbi:MAG: hypothetical protein CM15mP62_34500 [Rhodospirillaceae bacterium]|nr:MAG: hypothetical protein CM15mP62_34500 [Rhodospirillaceae bacterium]
MIIQRSLLSCGCYFGLSSFVYAQDPMVTTITATATAEWALWSSDLQAQGDTHLDGDWFDKRFSESYSHSI